MNKPGTQQRGTNPGTQQRDTQTIVYFKHGIGNLIMFTPAIQALAHMDRSGKVDICMSSDWKDGRRAAFDDFFERWSIVEDVINYPKMQFVKKYKRWFYTGHAEASDALEVFREKAVCQILAPTWSDNCEHEAIWYMTQVYKLGYAGAIPPQHVPLADGPVVKRNGAPVIGLCNGTFDGRMEPAKKWGGFARLSEVLQNYYGACVVKIGYKKELDGVSAGLDYVGKLSYTQTAKVISQMDLLITTDTANMHAADAIGTPMVVLFGGTLVSKNGPLSKSATLVRANLHCQPCQRTHSFYNCEKGYQCMSNITVGDVMAKVRGKLG